MVMSVVRKTDDGGIHGQVVQCSCCWAMLLPTHLQGWAQLSMLHRLAVWVLSCMHGTASPRVHTLGCLYGSGLQACLMPMALPQLSHPPSRRAELAEDLLLWWPASCCLSSLWR